ncbi:MAG: adenylate/guanylate cyclase domain-containing protein [Deltaproteobacteria bacterium]|nr:adenylate/guanylate cyclase domain-containing protein [Deltaproteobacteria bacterium]
MKTRPRPPRTSGPGTKDQRPTTSPPPSPPACADEAELAGLLLERSACCCETDGEVDERTDDRIAALDRRICRRFERDVAIFVLDMSGFTRITVARGILHYLMMIHRMRELCSPIVRRHRGVVVKVDADNLFARFPSVHHAVEAAMHIADRLAEANLDTDDESDIHVSIGIGWGPTLVLEHDLWGSDFNIAAKLGEDVAGAGEIWLTAAAHRVLSSPPVRTRHQAPRTNNGAGSAGASLRFRRRPLTLSGMPYTAWLLRPHAMR